MVFKNVKEELPNESYAQTKEVLAKLVSDTCDIPYDDVFSEIKRAHRESIRMKKDPKRKNGRHIYAAFHSWDLCQQIIDSFKKENIKNATFTLYAEQKYGPLTTQRRNLALQKRKALKLEKAIISGYVAFPAKLMVHTGRTNSDGKKVYSLHTDFSNHEIEESDD